MNPFKFLLSFISLTLLVVSVVGVTEVSFNNDSNILDSSGFSNPFVPCTPQIVTIPDILGLFYPNQSLTGSQYQTTVNGGGIPNKRSLNPPCTMTNIYGSTIITFVEIDAVWLTSYITEDHDCFKYINGTYCDNTGNIFDPTKPHSCFKACIHIEIDRDWQSAGQCGINYCDNSTLTQYNCATPCTAGTYLDFQGFVYWDAELNISPHWELHP